MALSPIGAENEPKMAFHEGTKLTRRENSNDHDLNSCEGVADFVAEFVGGEGYGPHGGADGDKLFMCKQGLVEAPAYPDTLSLGMSTAASA
jgi:hypothetical protein